MRELRSGACRGRVQQQEQPIAVDDGQEVAANKRRRWTPKNNRQVAQEPVAAAIDENIAMRDCGPTQSLEDNEEARLLEGVGDFGGEWKELVEEKKMEDRDSGGKSADKVAAGEDEGSTTPIPKKILSSVLEISPFKFSIKLVAYASRKEHINLEKWSSENMDAYKDAFFEILDQSILTSQ